MSARRGSLSVRLRLLFGTGLIAILAAIAALLSAYGAAQSARLIDIAARAEARIELIGALSGRVGDYAIVAVQQAGAPGLGPQERAARLTARAEAVRAAFARVDAALARAVEDARGLDPDEQAARATRSLGLARMRALFDALDAALAGETTGPGPLRAELDGFATRFSPLLNQAIEDERRAHEAAFAAVEQLRGRLIGAAAAVIAGAAGAVTVFHLAITRPLGARLGMAAAAAAAIGRGSFATRLRARGRDEIGLLFAQLNRAAARLGRARAAIDADRARLEEIVAERTRALREANVRLAAIDAERRRFFADVGHELRTPLTVILAETELNLGPDPAPQDARAAFATIRARAQRLNRRIDDILRVARSETGQIDLRAEPFDLGEVALGALDDVEGVARRRRVAIAPQIGPGPAVQGDRDWTRQVVAGILENAIRLSPEGGRIRLDLTHDAGGGAVLSVTDEGPGIAAGERERIFERFARGADQRSSGFGVGLALARWVMERQSGRIEVRSPAPRPVGPDARGPGAEFRLCLPPACGPAAGPRKGGAT